MDKKHKTKSDLVLSHLVDKGEEQQKAEKIFSYGHAASPGE